MNMKIASYSNGARFVHFPFTKTTQKTGQWLKLESSKKYGSQTKNGLINH